MLFHKYSYPVINPHVDCFEILWNDGKIYSLNCTHKNFEKKLESYVKKGILDWEDVSKQTFFVQNVSESFLRKHVDDLEWWSLLHGKPNLSESFLREIFAYIDWDWVAHNNKYLSKDIVREFKMHLTIIADDPFDFEDWIDEHFFVLDE